MKDQHGDDKQGRSADTLIQLASYRRKWARAAGYLGLALSLVVSCWILFLPGRRLHSMWATWGRLVTVIAMCVFFPWLYAAGTAVNLWWYEKSLRRIGHDIQRTTIARKNGK